MRVLVVNVNTTASVTTGIVASARAVAAAGTEIVGLTPRFGAESVEGNLESHRSYAVVTTLDRTVPLISDRLRLAGLDARCAAVRLGLRTSKVRTYAPPRSKRITGWPL